MPPKKITKYCCRSCQAKDIGKKFGKMRGEKRRKGKIITCNFCKKEIYIAPYRFLIAKFCSRKCTALAHPENTKKAQSASPLMKRARYLSSRKYKIINIDGKRIYEHRYIMEKYLNRKLERNEHIHHINGDPMDNRIENLQLLTNSEHQKLELKFFSSLK